MLAHKNTLATQIQSIDQLRQFTYETLCDQETLEVGAFPMTERLLRRSDAPCGILFCLQGPRSVLFNAVWETDRNTILFYGSGGERSLTIRLTGAPTLREYQPHSQQWRPAIRGHSS
jgi:hypothetical protein